jgi:hypothetical protein
MYPNRTVTDHMYGNREKFGTLEIPRYSRLANQQRIKQITLE